MLDEMERSIHDALCVVKRVLEGKKLVVGGGAVETALNVYLENFALNLVYIIFILYRCTF
jgi:T-complex protein 1 subunit alpha